MGFAADLEALERAKAKGYITEEQFKTAVQAAAVGVSAPPSIAPSVSTSTPMQAGTPIQWFRSCQAKSRERRSSVEERALQDVNALIQTSDNSDDDVVVVGEALNVDAPASVVEVASVQESVELVTSEDEEEDVPAIEEKSSSSDEEDGRPRLSLQQRNDFISKYEVFVKQGHNQTTSIKKTIKLLKLSINCETARRWVKRASETKQLAVVKPLAKNVTAKGKKVGRPAKKTCLKEDMLKFIEAHGEEVDFDQLKTHFASHAHFVKANGSKWCDASITTKIYKVIAQSIYVLRQPTEKKPLNEHWQRELILKLGLLRFWMRQYNCVIGMDEFGLFYRGGKTTIIAKKGAKTVRSTDPKSEEKPRFTVKCAVTTTGKKLPLFFVIQGKEYTDGTKARGNSKAKAFEKDMWVTTQQSAWCDKGTMKKWIEAVFQLLNNEGGNFGLKPKEPLLMIVDEFGAHADLVKFMEGTSEADSVLRRRREPGKLCTGLTGHTHLWQVHDVGLVKQLKCEYNKLKRDFRLKNEDQIITPDIAIVLLRKAWDNIPEADVLKYWVRCGLLSSMSVHQEPRVKDDPTRPHGNKGGIHRWVAWDHDPTLGDVDEIMDDPENDEYTLSQVNAPYDFRGISVKDCINAHRLGEVPSSDDDEDEEEESSASEQDDGQLPQQRSLTESPPQVVAAPAIVVGKLPPPPPQNIDPLVIAVFTSHMQYDMDMVKQLLLSNRLLDYRVLRELFEGCNGNLMENIRWNAAPLGTKMGFIRAVGDHAKAHGWRKRAK